MIYCWYCENQITTTELYKDGADRVMCKRCYQHHIDYIYSHNLREFYKELET